MREMNEEHIPVLLKETLFHLDLKPGNLIIDVTVGRGGHALGILKAIGPKGRLLGLDKDITALKSVEKNLENFSENVVLAKGDFTNVAELARSILGFKRVDGVLMDLGLSSPQLDQAERGFSYRFDAPIDMRMDRDQKLSAYDVVNEYSKEELASILKTYGEERWASRIASFIVEERKRGPIKTTFELVEIIKAAIPASARRRGGHPAKQSFQAIRIEVNGELKALSEGLKGASEILNLGGRLVVITYHSLEDRIVKEFFKKMSFRCSCSSRAPICTCGKEPVFKILTKKPVKPEEEEILTNPRSKSAKLRAAIKIGEV